MKLCIKSLIVENFITTFITIQNYFLCHKSSSCLVQQAAVVPVKFEFLPILWAPILKVVLWAK